eukprot:jgi/Mesvir1/11703/Mv00092-RA.1
MARKEAPRCFVLLLLLLAATAPSIVAWGSEGHQIVAEIAQSRLSPAAAEHVRKLLPEWAQGLMGRVASWADYIRGADPRGYGWTTELHYINTPDDTCSYNFSRDCKNHQGIPGFCVAGAVANYTYQLATGVQAIHAAKVAAAARSAVEASSQGDHEAPTNGLLLLHKASQGEGHPSHLAGGAANGYNLTEALLFLIHFMGDLHQPLHCGHQADEGGELIHVHFNGRACLLHQVWDGLIIREAIADDFQGYLEDFEEHITRGINEKWQADVVEWLRCENLPPAPPLQGSNERLAGVLDGACADKYVCDCRACAWCGGTCMAKGVCLTWGRVPVVGHVHAYGPPRKTLDTWKL